MTSWQAAGLRAWNSTRSIKTFPAPTRFTLQGQNPGKYRKDQKIIQAAEAEAKEAAQHPEKLSAAARKPRRPCKKPPKPPKKRRHHGELLSRKENRSLKAKAAYEAKAAAEKPPVS